MTQNDMILEHLKKHGSITQAEAVNLFGCYRLGARIWELKEQGVKIHKTMIESINRYGERTRFACYGLQEPQNV